MLYKTLDGGLTWTKETVEQEFQSIDFLDADHGVGITSFDIYLTEDGGHTWTEKDCLVGQPYGTASYIGIDDIWANGVSSGVEGAFHYIGK